jgi:hypothetical protein
MANTTFQGPVRSLNGFYTFGPGTVVNVPNGTNTLTLDPMLHAGRILRTNDASLILTLPTINASTDPVSSGPGSDPNTLNNQGVVFRIFVETTATAIAIKTDTTDKFVGSIELSLLAGGASNSYSPAASNDVINFNGTTTGGIAGTLITITALTTLKWLVEGSVIGSGVLATPFADA